MEKNIIEICCYNLDSALIAADTGADRVELCADPGAGGTTPGIGLIKTVRKKINIELYPIIRIRGGDFLFSDEEFEVMLHEVEACKAAGCEGVVTGMLLPDGRVDKTHVSLLVAKAYPMGVCFHRAFDWTRNPFEALEDIISIGCENTDFRATTRRHPGCTLDQGSCSAGRWADTNHARIRSACGEYNRFEKCNGSYPIS